MSLIHQISTSLTVDNTGANHKRWTNYIIENNIKILDLIELIHYPKPVAIRFSWVLGGICEIRPTLVYPAVTYLFTNRNEILIPNFNRSLAKMFWLCGVPKEIEGEVIDELFKWLLDAKANVTTKTYAMFALYKLCFIHNELGNELKISIEDQLEKNSISFQKRAKAILQKL
jgi:hypothetical protein